MFRLPFPVYEYLVPIPGVQAPEGFTCEEARIMSGFPHTVNLLPNLQLVLFLPNGVATLWRDADPGAVVSDSDDQRLPLCESDPEKIPHLYGPPLRAMLIGGGDVLASVPIVAGGRCYLPHAGGSNRMVRIELIILEWFLTAGSLRGSGDFGSKFSFAWRIADQASDSFSTPPIHPEVNRRIAGYTAGMPSGKA